MAKNGYGNALALQAMASDAQLGLMNRRPRRAKGAVRPIVTMAVMCLAVPLIGLAIGAGSAIADADNENPAALVR